MFAAREISSEHSVCLFVCLSISRSLVILCSVIVYLLILLIFSVRYLSSSVRLSVVCLSVTFVHPTQAIEIFGNVSTPFGTLAISDLSIKILQRSSQGNLSIGELKTRG